MKTKIFFACLAFCFAWQASAQTEFAPIGAEWYYNYGFQTINTFSRIASEEDIIVEGNNCRVLRQYYDFSINDALVEYIIKQEQGKVYYYYQDQFNLLFDFDAEVNDIIEFTFKYKKYDFNGPAHAIEDTTLSLRFKVEEITIDIQNLKTFITRVLDEDVPNPKPWYFPYYYIYTEKIGSQIEFMPELSNLQGGIIAVPMFFLRCYSDADFSYIIDWVEEGYSAIPLPCDYPLSNNSISIAEKDENIKISPNPFCDNISVFATNGGNMEIIDISGKVIYCSKLSNGVNEIATSHLPKGIFFVKIQNKDDGIQTFKTVKL